MKFLPAALLGLLSLVPAAMPAQEIGYLDLTDNTFRESSRRVGIGGGGCGYMVGGAQRPQSEVSVTLVSLDKTRYRIGEEATFEIKILNTGKKIIVVPWTPHLGDLEPTDEQIAYTYRVASVLVRFTDPEGREFFLLQNLYGSQSSPTSLRELLPGQWFTVRGRKKIVLFGENWGKEQFGDSGFVEAKVSGFYSQDRGTYSPKNGGSRSQWCIPLPCQKANSLTVVLERP